MNRKYIYFILALSSLSGLLVLFTIGNQSALQADQELGTETPPFSSYISGSGIVEPASGNVLISAPFNRLIEKIYVKANDPIHKGEILFQLYNEDLQANLKIRQKKYEASLANLQKLEILPREEDCLIAQANLREAEAKFNMARVEYCAAKRCATSRRARCLLTYKYQQAEAEFQAAQAQAQKILSGTWSPDLRIAQDEVAEAKADIEAMEEEIARTYVLSPLDGTVLQVKIHEGEISDPGTMAMTLGTIDGYHLRVSIDQFNQQRFDPHSPAVAFKQGDLSTEFPLELLSIEPSMVPKKYLTNDLQEKVDTQVFEILYRIKQPPSSHLFIGEQMDVYINVKEEDKA